MIVDSHQHFWDIRKFVYRWMPPGPGILRRNYLPEDLIPALKQNNICRTVLVEAHNSLAETRFLLELADRHDFIAGVVGWVDLTDREVGTVLDNLCRHPKLVGIRHQVESDPDEAWLVRDPAIRGLRELADRGLAYDLVIFPRHLKYIPPLADRVPDLRMVVDHIGKPPIASAGMQPWAADIAAVARIPNAWCKVSGLATQADPSNWSADDLKPWVKHVVETFGMDRLMWGSDWPVCLKAASYAQTLESALEAIGPISADDRTAFLSGNAITFYRLEGVL